MLQDDSRRERAELSKDKEQPSTSKLVSVPLVSGRVKNDPVPEPTDVRSLPSSPPSIIPASSKYNLPKNEPSTPESAFPAAYDTLKTFPSAIDPIPGLSKSLLDVYARPYVPSELRSINEEVPDDVIITEKKHKIEFGAYSRKFVGSEFLNYQPSVVYKWPKEEPPKSTELTEQSYIQCFASLLQQENLAREQENEGYALYKVPLQAIPSLDDHYLWALSIPGLREDSPLVELGDTLQIRHLWVDHTGNLAPVPTLFQADSKSYVAYKSWTGKQFDASVYNVSRVIETAYLRIDGLAQRSLHYGQNILPIAVNVVFPLKQNLLADQRRALLFCGRCLEGITQYRKEITTNFNGPSKSSTESQSLPIPSASLLTSQNDWIRRMLFPAEIDGEFQTQLRRVPHRALFDHAINYEQAQAVDSVCAVDYGTLPFIISGPPGTGKTKTLVEVAMQLLNSTDVAHMLICAPSEAAADTLAIRLKQYLTSKQLLRCNRPNRAENEVPNELLPYCYMQDGMFYLPPFKVLLSFNVVITSCRDAAMLAESRLANADLWNIEQEMMSAFHPEGKPTIPSLHWGALLLDEAAQATEVDVLPAISVVCPPAAYPQDHVQPRFVMAGDENQLGPLTASRDSKFSTSLFARLLTRPIFSNHLLSRSKIKPSLSPPVLKRSMLPILYPPFTNLIRNYRSHPAILSVPSSHFYHDTLIPGAPLCNTPLQASSFWRGRMWPVLYIPHTGHDEIERDNGGWYNISEARLACSIAQKLVFESGVLQPDICIMSPFAAQVKLLRSIIRSERYAGGIGLWDVNIGPVEAFQGLEKRVVIICTTRTRQRFVERDVKIGAGLVEQKRKMNVALTRAKEALFVIGSPEVLGADEHWRAWMTFCSRNGLVDDSQQVWKDRELYKNEKVGVLERALIAQADGLREKQWPSLGAAAAGYDIDGGEYEAWAEGLRQALDEEVDQEEYDDEADGTLEENGEIK
ncbi:RNA helicase [Ascochyta rabiei]|uniref:Uncharacterized protein n=1 Tax=Didymella rabiei TaxID=5454 RepID=A0A163FFN5_DIDRA|nr:RNA helicase [Ascochyta rabiei]KZM24330.1 hypothetical protein ST47_g4539 [Ascochyta rabiei]UPX15190.1 RNA helicase [Ascochyta rabiei]